MQITVGKGNGFTQLDVPDDIHFLPHKDGCEPNKWFGGWNLLAYKICQNCGKRFHPAKGHGITQFAKKRFCCKRCFYLKENPMKKEQTRKNLSKKLKSIGWKPPVRYGNGYLSPIQEKWLDVLKKDGWVAECAIKTNHNQWDGSGYPTCYKVDLGNAQLKLAIELDGFSHNALARKALDRKKDAFLQSIGWKVLRLKNKDAELRYMIYKSKGTPLFSPTDF